MRTQLNEYICNECGENTLGFTIKSHPTEAYSTLLNLNCSNCNKQYPETKSNARTNNRKAHKEQILKRFDLEQV